MAEIAVLLSSAPVNFSSLVPFLIDKYIVAYHAYLDSSRFASMTIDGMNRFVNNSCYGVNRVTAVGEWMKRCQQWCCCGLSLRVASMLVLVDIPLTLCVQNIQYVAWLAKILARYVHLQEEVFMTQSPSYVTFRRPFDKHYLLANFDYW